MFSMFSKRNKREKKKKTQTIRNGSRTDIMGKTKEYNSFDKKNVFPKYNAELQAEFQKTKAEF